MHALENVRSTKVHTKFISFYNNAPWRFFLQKTTSEKLLRNGDDHLTVYSWPVPNILTF